MEDSRQDPASPGDRAAQLAARRAVVLAQLEETDQELGELRHTREGEADDDEHDPDGVPLSAQWSRLEGLRLARLEALAEIEAAQERLSVGEDGRCRRCGAPIAPARLAVRPEATTCIDCAG